MIYFYANSNSSRFFRQKIVPDMALNMHQVVLNIYMKYVLRNMRSVIESSSC